ncbi:MAG: hypothetical protein M3P27_12060 [Acidobacteriota bacterium]|nr:hypothetical protein [Acidobacteriota bacterium]
MNKMLFVWGWVGCIALALVLIGIGVLGAVGASMSSSPDSTAAQTAVTGAVGLIGLAYIPLLAAAVIFLVMMYKMWGAIQDGQARSTPGKAVGFMFIPFFNIYWAFQAIWGWAQDYNKYIARHNVRTQPVPEGLFLTYVILCFVAVIPVLGLLAVLVNIVIGVMMASKICDAVNALSSAPRAAAAVAGT